MQTVATGRNVTHFQGLRGRPSAQGPPGPDGQMVSWHCSKTILLQNCLIDVHWGQAWAQVFKARKKEFSSGAIWISHVLTPVICDWQNIGENRNFIGLNPSTNQSINRSIDRSINQSVVYWSINKLINQSINQLPIDQSISQSIDPLFIDDSPRSTRARSKHDHFIQIQVHRH